MEPKTKLLPIHSLSNLPGIKQYLPIRYPLVNYISANARSLKLQNKLMETCKYLRDIIQPYLFEIILEAKSSFDFRGTAIFLNGTKKINFDAYKVDFIYPKRLRVDIIHLDLGYISSHADIVAPILDRIDCKDFQYFGECQPRFAAGFFAPLRKFSSNNATVALQAFTHANKLTKFALKYKFGQVSLSDFIAAGENKIIGHEKIYFDDIMSEKWLDVDILYQFFNLFVIRKMEVLVNCGSDANACIKLEHVKEVFGEKNVRREHFRSGWILLKFRKPYF